MTEKIRFGIIGCGGIAARFANALKKSDCAELYACAARDPERARAFAGAHGAALACESYEALIRDGKVQAVYIATVHTAHAAVARQCLRAGKPVLCEKPFFVNGEEAEETVALAREKQVLMMEGFWTRTQPAFLKAREWIREGRIGRLTLIRAAFCFANPCTERTKHGRLWDPALGGGALLDAGVYPYEYVTGLMGGEPDDVRTSVVRGPTGVDATVAMALRYDSGVLADCLASIEGRADTAATLSGTEGFILQEYFPGCRRTQLYGNGGELLETFEDPEEEGFVHEIAHFVRCLREGRTESDLIPLRDTLAFARFADRVLRG